MSPTLVAVVGYATWTALLVLALAGIRVTHALKTKKALNAFAPSGEDLEGLARRWTRAHLNCVEMLPVFAAIALTAVAAGRSEVTDPLAMIVLYARVAQSLVHIISTAQPMILVRGTFFFVQILIFLWWAKELLSG